MLVQRNLHLQHIIKITWKVDFLMLMLCMLAYYVDHFWIPDIHIPPALPTLMGTAIAFFIGFNNNQAYDRWWEARIIWGALVNESRSWARSLVAFCDATENEKAKQFKHEMIRRHLAFITMLRSSLRNSDNDDYAKYISTAERKHIENFANRANAILDIQAAELEKLKKENIIDNFQFLTLSDLLRSFCTEMGRCERIKNTVFPTNYIYFTRLFIWIFVVLLTMTVSNELGAWSILAGWVMGFVFHVTHINGMTIMNPFENDPASVPINSITRTIEINLLQALEEKEIPAAVAPVDGEYIL